MIYLLKRGGIIQSIKWNAETALNGSSYIIMVILCEFVN